MATNASRNGATHVDGDDDRRPGEYLEGYDDPVVTRTRLRADGVFHDPDETALEAEPDCRFSEKGSRWRVRERDDVDELSKCSVCSEAPDGEGGGAGGEKPCPMCGEDMHATYIPKHIRTECDG